MGTAWQVLLPVLLIAALSLIIPLAIVLGHRHPTGALLLSSGGSLVALSALWLVFDGSRLLDGSNTSPDGGTDGGAIARMVLFALGALAARGLDACPQRRCAGATLGMDRAAGPRWLSLVRCPGRRAVPARWLPCWTALRWIRTVCAC